MNDVNFGGGAAPELLVTNNLSLNAAAFRPQNTILLVWSENQKALQM